MELRSYKTNTEKLKILNQERYYDKYSSQI